MGTGFPDDRLGGVILGPSRAEMGVRPVQMDLRVVEQEPLMALDQDAT
jgi:hypothetical protein